MIDRLMPKNKTKQRLIDAGFDLFGVGVHLKLPEDMYQKFQSTFTQFLPEVQFIAGKKLSIDIDINIAYGPRSLKVNGYSVRFSAPADLDRIVIDAVLITSRLIEMKLNKKGIFSIHGSAVSYGDECVLIIGPSGAGKTTTAVYTCMLDKELAYAAGNRIFVDSKDMRVIGGVKKSSLRLGSIRNEFNEFQNLQTKESIKSGNLDTDSAVQVNRISVWPSQLGICESGYPLRVKAVIILRKMDSNLCVLEKKGKTDSELLAFYTALSEYSERMPAILMSALIPYPDEVSYTLKKKRLYFSNQFLASKPVIYIEGRLPEIARSIKQYLKNGAHTDYDSSKLLRDNNR
ncbi:MAG: hypothetical protein LVQ97_02395 [Candidatus Micrarchaeales archaeon]|jgi:energy-coupling factor transporter ATP-binding protein EcfA2|nr:hypothetical protein [Candidatus Micrarchaeales archaeon]